MTNWKNNVRRVVNVDTSIILWGNNSMELPLFDHSFIHYTKRGMVALQHKYLKKF